MLYKHTEWYIGLSKLLEIIGLPQTPGFRYQCNLGHIVHSWIMTQWQIHTYTQTTFATVLKSIHTHTQKQHHTKENIQPYMTVLVGGCNGKANSLLLFNISKLWTKSEAIYASLCLSSVEELRGKKLWRLVLMLLGAIRLDQTTLHTVYRSKYQTPDSLSKEPLY